VGDAICQGFQPLIQFMRLGHNLLAAFEQRLLVAEWNESDEVIGGEREDGKDDGAYQQDATGENRELLERMLAAGVDVLGKLGVGVFQNAPQRGLMKAVP
jgi:hypothetical protein